MDIAAVVTDPNTILAVIAGLFGFGVIIVLGGPLLNRNTFDTRMKSVANRREELKRRSREALAAKSGQSKLRQTDEGLSKTVVDRLRLSTLLEDSTLDDKLAQAGFRGPRPKNTFYFFRFVAPFVFAAAIGFYLFVVHSFNLPVLQRICCCFAGLLLGFYAPNLYLSNVTSKRRESIVAGFPDSLDLLLICVESGMSIEAALQKVSQEVGGASIELAEELSLLVAELSYLPDRTLAYQGFAKRTNNPGIKSVATAMIQAERYGTPLGTALRVISQESRDNRLMEAEKKAAALPPKLTVPMILFFLPVLFAVIMTPAIIQIMAVSK